LRGIFHGERFIRARVSDGHVAPEREHHGAGFAIDKYLSPSTWRRRDYAIVNPVVIGKRRNADQGSFACTRRRCYVHKNNIVVDGQSGHWCAVGPHQIVLCPAFAVSLKGEVRIIRNDVAINALDSSLHDGISKILQGLDGKLAALGMNVVR
jgi:hypothetical protein